jgi:hypothetical protein
MNDHRVKLTGGPEKTVTWIWLEDHRLKIEFYDFSELAQRMFGNDIAYTITVNDMDPLFLAAKQDETSLVQWLTGNFKSYFGIKHWLEENSIEFFIETESWA